MRPHNSNGGPPPLDAMVASVFSLMGKPCAVEASATAFRRSFVSGLKLSMLIVASLCARAREAFLVCMKNVMSNKYGGEISRRFSA
jgi:hypothetical protein